MAQTIFVDSRLRTSGTDSDFAIDLRETVALQGARVRFDKIRFVGYAFQIEMKFATRQLGYKIIEVPITFTDRIEGISKMSNGIIKEAVFGVMQMRWRSFFSSYGIS